MVLNRGLAAVVAIINMIRSLMKLKGLTGKLKHGFSEFPTNGSPPAMGPFRPEEHGLSSDFILTNFTKMKG